MVNKVCCIVYKEDKYDFKFLIMHKNNWWNGWEFVKGEVDNNEDVVSAALREVNQETGLNLNKINEVPFNYSYNYTKELNTISSEVSCFIVKANDDLVTLSSEHNHYKWVDFNRALNLLEFEEQKKLLEFAYNKLIRIN